MEEFQQSVAIPFHSFLLANCPFLRVLKGRLLLYERLGELKWLRNARLSFYPARRGELWWEVAELGFGPRLGCSTSVVSLLRHISFRLTHLHLATHNFDQTLFSDFMTAQPSLSFPQLRSLSLHGSVCPCHAALAWESNLMR